MMYESIYLNIEGREGVRIVQQLHVELREPQTGH